MEIQFEEREVLSFLTDSKQLNDALGGYGIESGNLLVVQSPTGDGKTTFMMRLAILAAKGHKVAYISCGEQDVKELSVRFARMVQGEQYKGVQKSRYTEDEYNEIIKCCNNSKCYKNIEVYYETQDVCSTVINAVKAGAQFVFIDYIGCLLAEQQNQQYSYLTKISSWLKEYATENNVGIITAMQTNRLLLNELKQPEFDPITIDGEFMADSIGPAKKATICISWFRRKGTRYLTLYKNRFNGEKLSIQIDVEKNSYKWNEFYKPDAGF